MKLKFALPLFVATMSTVLHAQNSSLTVISELAVGERVLDIATGDFNQDGNIDLAVHTLHPGLPGESSGTAIFQYFGNGDGTLSEANRFDTTNNGGVAPTIADFSGDGIPDLITGRVGYTTNRDGFFNPGQEVSQRLQTCGHPQVIDLESDGTVEIVCTHNSFLDPGVNTDFGISVLRNFGNYNFRLNSLATVQTEASQISNIFNNNLVKGDINNDGVLDFASVSTGFANDGNFSGRLQQHNVGTFLGTGNSFNFHSGWSTTDFFDTNNPFSSNDVQHVALTDTNNDNNLDLVVLVGGFRSTPLPFISVHIGNGTGTFSEQGIITTLNYARISDVDTIDANNDGIQDLVIAHLRESSTEEPGNLVIMHGNGNSSFAAPINLAPQHINIQAATAADFNNDGPMEIVASAGFDFGRIIILSDNSSANTSDNTIDEINEPETVNAINGLCNSADSDPDGDGWGWENNQSCRVNTIIPENEIADSDTNITVCMRADSDFDGDGWGWENNTSCRVNSEDNTSTETTAAVSSAICQSSASDPDGDGWGWENNASCRVITENNTSTEPTTTVTVAICQSSASDPDGDGWGWENNSSCRVQ